MAFWLPIPYLGRVRWETAKEQFRVVLVAGINDSCSGYAGSRPWLLSAVPPRKRKMTPSRPGKRKNADLRAFLLFEPGFAGQSSPSAHWRGHKGSGPPGNPGGGGSAVYPAD